MATSAKRRSDAEIQRLRGMLAVPCQYSCGKTVYILSTLSGRTVVLSDQQDGPWVISESDKAVSVGTGGDYGFHRCAD